MEGRQGSTGSCVEAHDSRLMQTSVRITLSCHITCTFFSEVTEAGEAEGKLLFTQQLFAHSKQIAACHRSRWAGLSTWGGGEVIGPRLSVSVLPLPNVQGPSAPWQLQRRRQDAGSDQAQSSSG